MARIRRMTVLLAGITVGAALTAHRPPRTPTSRDPTQKLAHVSTHPPRRSPSLSTKA